MKQTLRHIILLFVLFIGGMQFASAQWDTTWIKTYGGNRDDVAMDIITTPDNGFMVIGSTSSFGFDNSQMYFLKLDSTGAIMWSKSHGGSGQEWGTSVINTSDGGYVGVGYTNSWGSGGFDFYMVKLDSFGGMEYETYTGGTDWEFAWDVIEVAPKEYVIAGETQSFGAGGKDGWLVKYNENTSQFDWDKTIGTSKEEYFKSVALGQNGDILAAGGGVKPGRTDEDVLITKLNSLGDTLWSKFYGDTLGDYANDIIWMSDGNYALTGQYHVKNESGVIGLMILASSGIQIKEDTWGVSPNINNAIGKKIMEIDSNRVSISGTYEYTSGAIDFMFGYSYPFGLFYQNGSTLGSLDTDILESSTSLGSQGYVFVGTTDGFSATFDDILIYKTDTEGVTYDFQTYEHNTDSSNITNIRNLGNSPVYVNYKTGSPIIKTNCTSCNITYKIFSYNGAFILEGNINSNDGVYINQLPISDGLYIFTTYSNSVIEHGSLIFTKFDNQ